MKKMIFAFSIFSFLFFTAFTTTTIFDWKISDDYSIKFSGSSANGTFSGLDGAIFFDKNHLENSKMDVSVDVNTISTGNKTKDKHARSKKWFYAEKYPKIKFRSKSFSKNSLGYVVKGDLEIRGITKEIFIPFVFNENEIGGNFLGKFKVKRKDFGITGPIINFTVSNTIELELRVPVEK